MDHRSPDAAGHRGSSLQRRIQERQRARIRMYGWGLRAAVAIALVVAATMLDPDAGRVFGYGIAFLWLPVAGLADAWRARRPGRATDALVVLLDGVLVVSTVVLVPEALAAVALAQLLLVAAHGQLDDPWLGSAAATGSFGLVLYDLLARDSISSPTAVALALLYAVVLVGILWTVRVARADRADSAASISHAYDRSETILAGVGEAVVVTASGGRIRRVNAAGEHVFACHEDAVLGLACHEALELRDGLSRLDCSRVCPLLDGESRGQREVWRELPTGVRQPLLVNAWRVKDHQGEATEVVHSFRDITTVKQAEEAKTMFLATASHELKTPLTVIRGFAEMLEANPELGEDEAAEAYRAIAERSRELTRIVDRLLLTSRIDAGEVDLAVVAGDPEPVVAERVHALAGATGRDIVLLVDGPLRCQFATDALGTVTDHLLENALKYSPDGGRVTVELSHGPDQAVVLSVTDQGIGMTPAQLEQCFDRFFQGEGSDVRRFAGTGIGLYIVRSLVEGMDGRVGVESAPGKGSTFTVTLAPEAGWQRAEAPIGPSGERTMVEEFMRQVGVTRKVSR